MSTFRLIGMAAMALSLTYAADDPARVPDSAAVKLPPVLHDRADPVDSVLVTLPGAPRAKTGTKPEAEAAPAPAEAPKPEPSPEAPAPVSTALVPHTPDPSKAIGLARSFLPPDLQKEVAIFCQRLIGQWSEEDAEQLLGKPLRNRLAFDEKKSVNGRIYAFADPTGRYRELELDFDQSSGILRTVFAYPKGMTWQECRRRWNGEVSEADAQQGRTFYSYINRRLDVLVDAKGKVISLGLY
jgi:hypothetical protein